MVAGIGQMTVERRLVITRGESPFGVFTVDLPVTSIGRSASNTVVLEGPAVSRWHAILTFGHDGICHVQDVGSRNGTFVAGERVGRTRLLAGRDFTVGPYRCQLVETPAPGSDGSGPADDATRDPSSPSRAAPAGPESRDGNLDPQLFLGTSEPTRDLLRKALKVAPSRIHVLITGESGSGKGVLGRLIHASSDRCRGPFVALNCAAIPGELVESELFGHRRGSFSGALADRIGKFQAADGGTLFLDEVGDMSGAAQAKILRAIEEQEIEPVGSPRPVHVDVRVLAATNRDIDAAVREGQFREDLLFRLAAVRLHVPPLRERPDDIVLLANCFLAQILDEVPSGRGSFFTSAAVEALLAHPWPGNARELRNAVAQAVLLREENAIGPADLRLAPPRTAPAARAPTASLAEVEGQQIETALAHHGWNILRTAKALGIQRKTLRDRIERLGLRRPGGETS